MRIAFVAAEAVPFKKVGGLADVVGSLPHNLLRAGLDVTVTMPWYRGIEARPVGRVRFVADGVQEEAALGEAEHRGVRYRFIGLPDFDREKTYGYADDVRRFVRFSLAAAETIDADVVHAHDWQAAILPVLAHAGRLRARTVLTIHNLLHQGLWHPMELLRLAGLPEGYHGLEGLEYHGLANLMKGGIVFADRVTTVSPTYADEIQTPAWGEGLDGVLRRYAGRLAGICNGLDTEYWDPAGDPRLPAGYSLDELGGKRRCEEALREELGLEGTVLGIVSRLDTQKGIVFALQALPFLLELGYSLAVLGSGHQDLEVSLRVEAERRPTRVFVKTGYDEDLAHRIYAGATAFLMPSRFEPCGLSQMIAQRYGTPPIVRATGGLRDTVHDGVTGVQFQTAHGEGVIAGLARYHHHPDHAALVRACMEKDVSWDQPSQAYARLYRDIAG